MTKALRVAVFAAWAGGCAIAHAEWKAASTEDALDPAKKTISVYSEAKAPIKVHGRDVDIRLTVLCHRTSAPKQMLLGAGLIFSDPAGFGESWMRWRVDKNPIGQYHGSFSRRGTSYALFSISAPEFGKKLVDQMRGGSLMKIEAETLAVDKQTIEFDIAGADEAFKKIACGSE